MAQGLAFAVLFPVVPLGGLAAAAYALAHPPLAGVTGIGRWEVHTLFSALGAALSLWVVLGPALALAMTLARLAGLRASLLCGLASWAVVFPGLSVLGGGLANGGLSGPGIATEVFGWAMVLLVPATLGAVWTGACVAVARRWRLSVARRGLAPADEAP